MATSYIPYRPATRFSEIINPTETQPMMSGAFLSAPSATSSEKRDSCSPNYVSTNRGSAAPTGPVRISRRHTIRIKAKRAFRAIGQAFKKVFRVKSKKSSSSSRSRASAKRESFLMPYDMSARDSAIRPRSSMRSRLPKRSVKKTRMTAPSPTSSQTLAHLHNSIGAPFCGTESNRSSADAISIIRTSPSGKRLTIHSYTGPKSNSEPEPVRRSVLIAHPATTDVIAAPDTPMTITTVADSVADSDDSWSTISENEGIDAASSLDFAGQVNPTEIYRTSFLGTEIQGSPEAFHQLCDQLDGFKKKVAAMQTVAAQPRPATPSPQMPYLSRTTSLSLESVTDAQPGANNGTDTQRLGSPEALTGGATADETASIATAIAAAPAEKQSHPPSLTPGKLPSATIKRKPVARRPASTGGLYLAYPGRRFNPFNEPLSSPTKLAAPTIDADATLGARDSSSDSNRSSTPCEFADAETHKKHYSRVELGIFDDLSVTPLPPYPANSRPNDRFSYFSASSPTTLGALPEPTSPPSPPVSIKRNAVGSIPNFPRKLPAPNTNKPLPGHPATIPNFSMKLPAANSNKPLPAHPATKGPAAVPMNANGYPILNRNSASNFSLEPRYQRRSVNDVEAKFKRDSAKKSEIKKLQKMSAEERAEKQEQAKQMMDAVGKILLCGS